MRIINASEVTIADIPELKKVEPPRGNRKKNKRVYYGNICAFDIETTTIPEIKQSVMYIWQFAIDTELVVIGRTWEEFRKFVKLLKAVCGMKKKLIVYVHNLSYEFQFLSGIYQFKNDDVFCTESRKILYCVLDCLEFRCSLQLTNLSLSALTRRYNVAHQKLSGEEYNYGIQRFSWTELSADELQYTINDVVGLVESINCIMELYNDTVYTIPLTSTGFVRRICRSEMKPHYQEIKDIYPDIDVYRMLLAEFRGGNTHANRYYAGEVIREPGNSFDISSSYPSAQCNRLYPVSPFQKLGAVTLSVNKVEKMINRHYALLFTVELRNVKLRYRYFSVPYIPIAKCSKLVNFVNDNGRVLEADLLEITVTDIDWKIIVNQYEFSAAVIAGYYAEYGKLPEPLIKENIEFFKQKTTLKGVEGQELYYLKNKELLNSIYGMGCQKPTKRTILFNDCHYDPDTSLTEEQLLEKSKRKAFTCYQFACWTTSHARAALEEGIKLCGDNLLYVDTDSCKFLGSVNFDEYNREQKELSLKSGLFAEDRKGVTHFGGVYEPDGEFTAFCTHGAKKYSYIDTGGKLHLTVSGVGKRRGVEALLAAGGIDAFQEGFIFHNCGKTASIYNDDNYGEYIIDGHTINITRNVVIEEKDYTLSRTGDYNTLLRQCKTFFFKNLEILQNSKIL